jgi:hypothetical protein
MTEYTYFASYRFHQTSPFSTTGAGRARIVAAQPITKWTDVEAMEGAIRDLHPECKDIIIMNYQLLGTDAAEGDSRDTLNITEQIEQAIERYGSVYGVLNMTLADLDIANALLVKEREKSTALEDVLETIRELVWMNGQPPVSETKKTIDRIACEALRIAGQIP